MYDRKLMHKEYLKKSELESWIFVDWQLNQLIHFNLFMLYSLWTVYCFQVSNVLFIYVKNWQVEY